MISISLVQVADITFTMPLIQKLYPGNTFKNTTVPVLFVHINDLQIVNAKLLPTILVHL